MFEVDWADYSQERVGQRRARKEAERQLKKEDARSSHGTLSTPASASSDQHHLSFFGSISRKKTIASSVKSKKQEPTTLKSESAKSDGKLKRSSFRFPRAARSSAAEPTNNGTIKEETGRPDTRHFPAAESAAEPKDHNKLGSPDRSSKESMLSKITQLTIPTLGLQPASVMPDPATAARFVQALDDDGSLVAKTVTTSYHHGGSKFSPPSQIRGGTKITASPTKPTTPKLPHTPHALSSPEIDKSAPEAIDDWYTALHGPARQLLRPGPNGIIRRGNVLLPPNVHRSIPVTPTRRSTKRLPLMPTNPSPIRFLADNPSDWKTPDEWNSIPSTGTPFPSPINHILDGHNDEAVPNPASSQLEFPQTWAAAAEDDRDGQHGDMDSAEPSTDNNGEIGSQSTLSGKAGAIKMGDGSTRATI